MRTTVTLCALNVPEVPSQGASIVTRAATLDISAVIIITHSFTFGCIHPTFISSMYRPVSNLLHVCAIRAVLPRHRLRPGSAITAPGLPRIPGSCDRRRIAIDCFQGASFCTNICTSCAHDPCPA